MVSPYCRTRQTFVGMRQAFADEHFAGVQEEVQLREQDFGNFQNPDKIKADLAERNRCARCTAAHDAVRHHSPIPSAPSIFHPQHPYAHACKPTHPSAWTHTH
jgi:hypothetical protein